MSEKIVKNFKSKMFSIITFLLLWEVCTVNAESHSLTYIYTAFTRPVNLPGIHTFSAVGLLDGRPIDYYDSSSQVKVPKETWMKERLQPDYWVKGTSSRKTKEQWFNVNLNILTQRLKKNDTENHVLQWRHGCKVTDGKRMGTDEYSYDGDDFLSFDSSTKQWVAPMTEAAPTKHKWDGIQQLNDYTEGYLHNECVQWLETFLKYREEDFNNASRPSVYVYAKTLETHLRLICMATGFYPKEITMNIWRDGMNLRTSDGLQSTGVRPNGDGTHQIKTWVKIPLTDKASYRCEVLHPGTKLTLNTEWDHQVEDDNTGIIAGGAAAAAVLLALIIITGLVLYFKRKGKAAACQPEEATVLQPPGKVVERSVYSEQLEEKEKLMKEGNLITDQDSGHDSGSNSSSSSASVSSQCT